MNGEKANLEKLTAHLAGLVQVYVTVVSCLAASHENTSTLSSSGLLGASVIMNMQGLVSKISSYTLARGINDVLP